MARGFGKDPRETYGIDRHRYRNRATHPDTAPWKNHCDIYVKDFNLYKMCEDGAPTLIGGFGVSASPGFTWGRKGNVGTNFYLLNDQVPSNKTGRVVIFGQPTLRKVLVTNSTPSTCTFTVQEHDGSTFTDLESVSLSAERAKSVDFSTSITSGKELAIKITSGSCKDPVVGVILDGIF